MFENMKRTRNQRAITLVALIITIIVLLILAVVAIRTVQGDGMIAHAKNAKSEYERVAEEENVLLSNLSEYITGQLGGTKERKWQQIKTSVTDGITTLEVGDYVDYQAGVEGYSDTKGWRVLGAENGQILLVSASNVVSSFTLSGAEDYLNNTGIGKLNTVCAAYGNGKYAQTGRTITAEDVNNVTGYNPNSTGDGSIYEQGKVYQYGNEVTYRMNNGKVAYSSAVISANTSGYSTFQMPDNRILGTNMDEVTVTSTSYTYNPDTLTTSSNGELKGIRTDSAAYATLFSNTAKADGAYWVATPYIYTSDGAIIFGIRRVSDGSLKNAGLYDTTKNSPNGTFGVRAVVLLEASVKLASNGANTWTLNK